MSRIVFDGGVLRARPWTGVARAFLATLEAYAAQRPCTLLAPPDVDVPEIDGVQIVPTGAVAGAIARQLRLPGLLRRLGADVLHSPVAALPRLEPMLKMVVSSWMAPMKLS